MKEFGKVIPPNLRAEGGNTVVRIEDEEKVIPAINHVCHHFLHNAIVGIYTDIVSLIPYEVEGEMDDLKVVAAEHRMPETESSGSDLIGNRLTRAQCEKPALLVVFLYHAHRDAWRISIDELSDE